MSLQAFVDESVRRDTYFLAAALVAPRNLKRQRTALRELLLPGQDGLRFRKENPPRRRTIVARLCAEEASVRIYRRSCGGDVEGARQDCLAALTTDLLDRAAIRLVIDSRERRDRHDERTIRALLGELPSGSRLSYEHVEGGLEQLVWIADAVAWCYGAGGDWRRRAERAVDSVVNLDDRS